MYKIKLKDGTIIENLKLSGNIFISSAKIEDEIFSEENLEEVEITEEYEEREVVTVYHNMFLVQNMKMIDQRPFKEGEDDEEKAKWWFILDVKPKEQVEKEIINELLNKVDSSITDIEVALTDVYEMIIGGM